MGAPVSIRIAERQTTKKSVPRTENSNGAGRIQKKVSPPRTENSGRTSTSTRPVANGNHAETVTLSTSSDREVLGSDRRFYNQAAELKKRAAAEGRTAQISGGRYVDPSDVHLYNRAEAGEAKRDEAAAQGRTVARNGEYIDPSDVHLYNRAEEIENKRNDAAAEGRTVLRNGEYINPSDVHLYNRAEAGEAAAAEREQAHAEGRTVEIDGKWVNPSDVHLYNRAAEAEAKAAEAGDAPATNTAGADEPFVVGKGDADNPYADHNATDVTVTAWDGVGGKPNDSVVTILRNQGYSDEQIWAPDANGVNLVDHVAQANDLNEEYLIHPGDELIVPTTLAATDEGTPAPAAPTSSEPEILGSDRHLHHLAEQAEQKKAEREGRTVEWNGQLVNPSDVHLYNRAAEIEKAKAQAEGRTVEVNGNWVHPSDVHLYNRR